MGSGEGLAGIGDIGGQSNDNIAFSGVEAQRIEHPIDDTASGWVKLQGARLTISQSCSHWGGKRISDGLGIGRLSIGRNIGMAMFDETLDAKIEHIGQHGARATQRNEQAALRRILHHARHPCRHA